MRNFCLYIVTPLTAFIGGLLSYILTLKLGWDEALTGDLRAVLFWGSALYALVVPFYFVVVYIIERRFKKFVALLYTIACMFIFLIPTFPIFVLFWVMTSPFSSVMILFYSFFISAGLIFGLCTWTFKTMNS